MVIPDHGCTWLWPANMTFTISAKDAALLAASDSEFERVICSGRYRYVEGHFCLNTDKYILRDYYGKPHLTVYTRCHMEECCLGFTVGGRYRRTEYAVSKVARNKTEPVTDKYRAAYRLVAEPGSSEYEKENQAMVDDGLLWLEFYKNIPDDFAEMIKAIMKRKGITLSRGFKGSISDHLLAVCSGSARFQSLQYSAGWGTPAGEQLRFPKSLTALPHSPVGR